MARAFPVDRAVDLPLARSHDVARRVDAVTVLSLYIGLLLFIPSDLIIGGFGFTVTPADVLGPLALAWWVYSRWIPELGGARGPQPVRYAMGAFACSIVASYAAAFARPMVPVEIRAADRGLFQACVFLGVALLSTDGIDSLDRLNVLLKRVVFGASIVASMGIFQFATGIDVARGLRLIPGLVANHDLPFIFERSIFRRVSGTAGHPIEFGAMLAMVLPLALHYAFEERDERSWLRWLAVALIGCAIPTSLSRTPIAGIVVGGGVLWLSWPSRRRLQALLVLPLAAVGIKLAVPGLLGTIRALFTYFFIDNSTTGRTKDYAVVGEYIMRHPILGQGFRTFLPNLYDTFDNEYMLHLVEAGIVGVLILVGVLITAFVLARKVLRRSEDTVVRDLGLSLSASMAVVILSFGTYDALSFPMVAGLVFLLIGCCGALWRLTRESTG